MGMSFIDARSSENKSFAKQSQVLSHTSTASIILSERSSYEKASESKILIKSFTKEEIRRVLEENIGSRNMLRLLTMIEFLESRRGRNASEEFIKNIILLSLLYGSGRNKKELAFVDIVFQALYETLTKSSK